MVDGLSRQRKRLLLVCVLVATATLSGRGYAQSTLLGHPALAKYPSPEDLQERIDSFKRERADEFEAARRDFELAMRSGLELTPIVFADERQPVRIKKWRAHMPVFRPIIEQNIVDFRAENRGLLRAAFYEAHLEDLTVEPTGALRYVLLDVILNGWDDWEAWTSERLEEYRRRYPDLYRRSALGLLSLMNHRVSTGALRMDATIDKPESLRASGVLLRMLLDSETSPRLAAIVQVSVQRIRNDVDALDFVVKLALDAESPERLRNNGRYCMGSLTESLPLDQQRDYWVQHLDSNDYSIRSAAVSRVGINIDLLKKDAKEQATNAQLAQRLRRMAAFDPDPRIRLEASRRVTAYEDDSPPRGLIDYSKGKN